MSIRLRYIEFNKIWTVSNFTEKKRQIVIYITPALTIFFLSTRFDFFRVVISVLCVVTCCYVPYRCPCHIVWHCVLNFYLSLPLNFPQISFRMISQNTQFEHFNLLQLIPSLRHEKVLLCRNMYYCAETMYYCAETCIIVPKHVLLYRNMYYCAETCTRFIKSRINELYWEI